MGCRGSPRIGFWYGTGLPSAEDSEEDGSLELTFFAGDTGRNLAVWAVPSETQEQIQAQSEDFRL